MEYYFYGQASGGGTGEGNCEEVTSSCPPRGRFNRPRLLRRSAAVALASFALLLSGCGPVISVASNEAPAEMAQIVELCEKGDFAAARKLHHWLFPLIQVNFVETNPIPCKTAMAAMGLIEESFRLPMVPPTAATRSKVLHILQNLKMLGAAARV